MNASCTMDECIKGHPNGVNDLGDFESTRAACWGGTLEFGCYCRSGRAAALTGRRSTTEGYKGREEVIYEYTCCEGSVDTVGESCGESSRQS